MINDGKVLGKWNILDASLVGVFALVAVGIMLVQSGSLVTSGKEVQGESDIRITVQIPSLKTLDKSLFVPGKTTAITIRNQPRGDVKIESVKISPVQAVFLNSLNHAVSVEDLSQKNSYDYTITLKDHALIAKDGYVTEGVKVKIGLPIELEGFKYRVYGKIVDVNPIKETPKK